MACYSSFLIWDYRDPQNFRTISMAAGLVNNTMSMDIRNLQVCMDDVESLLGEDATDTYSLPCYTSKVDILGSREGSQPHCQQVDYLRSADKELPSKFLKPEHPLHHYIPPIPKPTLQVYDLARFSFMAENVIGRVRKRTAAQTPSCEHPWYPHSCPPPPTSPLLALSSTATLVMVPGSCGHLLVQSGVRTLVAKKTTTKRKPEGQWSRICSHIHCIVACPVPQGDRAGHREGSSGSLSGSGWDWAATEPQPSSWTSSGTQARWTYYTGAASTGQFNFSLVPKNLSDYW